MTTRRKPKVVPLRKPKVDDDTQFIKTLVWALNEEGKVLGYAIVVVVDSDEARRTIEAACLRPDETAASALEVLGGMRLMEHNFIARNWPRDEIETAV